MNLYLIGYRGVGKSSVARLLGPRLNWDWVDSDVEIERKIGKSIAMIFASEGEAVFRIYETGVVRELSARDNTVIALGGGAVLKEDNRKLLKETGRVIWLTADPETILDRIEADLTTGDRRPNLTLRGGLEEIQEVLRHREAIYRECADLTIDTVGRTTLEVAQDIYHYLQPPA